MFEIIIIIVFRFMIMIFSIAPPGYWVGQVLTSPPQDRCYKREGRKELAGKGGESERGGGGG